MKDDYEKQDVSGVDNPEVGHEKRDVNVRIIVGFGASLVVAAILIHLFIAVLFNFFGHLETTAYPREFPAVQTSEVRLPPSPRLQDKPREDLKALRAHEDELLNTYTWINRQAGGVRIPIWQAMDQVMQQGFPVAPQPSQDTPTLPSSSSSGRVFEPSIKR